MSAASVHSSQLSVHILPVVVHMSVVRVAVPVGSACPCARWRQQDTDDCSRLVAGQERVRVHLYSQLRAASSGGRVRRRRSQERIDQF